jgi:enoyl-CoA hydratase
MTTNVTVSDGIARLQIDEPRGNALSYETIVAIEHALDDVQRSPALACVVEGRERVFSSGLDLRACAKFSRDEMAHYVDAFEELFERVFTFPKPLIAFVQGPAIAGGAVLALACDVRVMAPSAAIGLNEVELGIPFPSMALEVGRFGIPHASQVDGIMLGKKFSAQDALERGVVHEVASQVDVAMARAREFLSPGPNAVKATKAALRRESLERARLHAAASRKSFVEAFFAEEAQTRIQALVKKLETKT